MIVPSKSTTIRRLTRAATHLATVSASWPAAISWNRGFGLLSVFIVSIRPDRDALALAEPQQRLAVGGEQAPDRLLAMAVEVGVHTDVAGDGPAHGLVVLLAIIVLIRHRRC